MTNLTPEVAAQMLLNNAVLLKNAAQCEHGHGEPCASRAPGHSLSALQERVASATPSKWRDGLVGQVSTGGWIRIDLVEPNQAGQNEAVWVWSHADLTASVTLGLPVAVHALYHALAVGRERFNVLVAALGS
jgi:hypothetical protein